MNKKKLNDRRLWRKKKPLRIVPRSDLRVTFRAAGCCQSACRRRVACKRWIRGNSARVEGPRAAFISRPRCVDVSEGPRCCFLLGVFFCFVLFFKRNVKIPLQPSSVHFFFFLQKEIAKELIKCIMLDTMRNGRLM